MMDNNNKNNNNHNNQNQEQQQQQEQRQSGASNIDNNSSGNSTASIQLSDDYIPTQWDVMCQRGKESYDHVGNRRFRMCIDNHVEAYIMAPTRPKKTVVVVSIVKTIRENSARVGGRGFVRKDPASDYWYAVSDKAARERVGQALRDAVKQARKSHKLTSAFAIAKRNLILNPTKRRRNRGGMQQHAIGKQAANFRSEAGQDSDASSSINSESVHSATKPAAVAYPSSEARTSGVPPRMASANSLHGESDMIGASAAQAMEVSAMLQSNNNNTSHPAAAVPHRGWFGYDSEELEPLNASDPSLNADEDAITTPKQTNELMRATEALIQQLTMEDLESGDPLQQRKPPSFNSGHSVGNQQQSGLANVETLVSSCRPVSRSLTSSESISETTTRNANNMTGTAAAAASASDTTKHQPTIQNLHDFLDDDNNDGETSGHCALMESLPYSAIGGATPSTPSWEDYLDHVGNVELL